MQVPLRSVLVFTGALILAASAASGQAPPTTPRFNAGETVNVEVKIVPFYAVDAQGRPVYDLRPDEVELRVGGAPVAIDSFDSYVIPSGKGNDKASPLNPTPSRAVFFLFDLTFSSRNGFKADQRLAERLLDGWPAGDRITLITHGSKAGLERKLGPVPPDREGKQELLSAIAALQPEVRRIELQDDPTVDFGKPTGKASRSGNGVGEQVAYIWDGIQGGVRGEYRAIASGLAGSLQDLAGDLRGINGPKLLVLFSQGLDDGLYFSGDSGNRVGSDDSVEVDTRRGPPLMNRFREPLKALAEAGAVSLFVNTDRGTEIDADAALRHMAETTGGLYMEGRDPRDLEKRIASSTTAYYEAGFHPTAPLLQSTRAEVTVAVRRPGVRVWAPAAVRTRESYQDLSAFEKRRLAIDLIAGGPEAQSAHGGVRLKVQDLAGKVAGGGEPGQLRFEADWPADLAARKLDLYNVVLTPPANGMKGKVLRFDARDGVAAKDRGALATSLEGQDPLVWGILAVDPATEQAWVRRLRLQPPQRAQN